MLAAGGVPIPLGPAAALPAPLVPHVFQRVTLAGRDNRLDYVACLGTAKVCTSLPNLGWVDASSAGAGMLAAPCLAISILASASHFKWDDATMAPLVQGSELVSTFSLATLSKHADGWAALKVLDRVHSTSESFWDAAEIAVGRAPVPSPFEITPTSIEILHPFLQGGTPAVAAVAAVPAVLAVVGAVAVPQVAARAATARAPAVVAAARIPAIRAVVGRPAVPAVAAVAAVPASGPAELAWWSHVRIGDSLDRTHPLPFRSMVARGMIALDRCSALARSDPASRVRVVSSYLLPHLATSMGLKDVMLSSASAISVARHFRHFHPRLRALPDELRSGSFDPDVLEAEMIDDLSFMGTEAQQDSVTAGRLEHVQEHFPSLFTFLSHSSNGAGKVAVLQRLSGVLSEAATRLALFPRLSLLDVFLASHSSFITQCLNKGIPLEGADGLVSLLQTEHDDWKASNLTTGAAAPAADDSLGGSGRSGRALTEPALKRCLIEDADFVKTAEEILELDATKQEDRVKALELACLSRCMIFQIFFENPGRVLHRHLVFHFLYKCQDDFGELLGASQRTSLVSNTVDPLQESWTSSVAFMKPLLAANWTALSHLLINGEDGALALFNMAVSEPFSEVPFDQCFTVESVLETLIPFARATAITVGWNAVSTTGYTLASFFERQLRHIKWIRGMGSNEVDALLVKAQANCVKGLALATIQSGRLFGDPEPSGVVMDCILNFGSDFDVSMDAETKGYAPLIAVRRAFPHLLPASSPRSLPGVALPGPSKSPGKPPKDTSGTTGGSTAPKPGSKKGLASWPDDFKWDLQLGSFLFDCEAVANEYNLDVNEVCWPVMLTSKDDDARMSVCPCPKAPGHSSVRDSAHARPKGFNIFAVSKKFATGGKKQKTG